MEITTPAPSGGPRAARADDPGNQAKWIGWSDTMKLNKLPAMPKMKAATHDCACGCGLPTKREWHPGHDGRATGWAIRIERGIITIDDVPANERNGARIMLDRRKANQPVEATA